MDLFTNLYQQIETSNLWDSEISLRRGEYLKVGGTVETNLFYVVSGSLQISVVSDFQEYILRFAYSNNFATALDSFITGKPSECYIQALKKTKLKVLSKVRLLDFINSDAAIKEFWDSLLQHLLTQQMEREVDLLVTTPAERFNRVWNRSPNLFQEIPNKYIAAYLRMSPETLSRLKKS